MCARQVKKLLVKDEKPRRAPGNLLGTDLKRLGCIRGVLRVQLWKAWGVRVENVWSLGVEGLAGLRLLGLGFEVHRGPSS